MRNSADRDKMTKYVNDTYAKYPSVDKLPVADSGNTIVEVSGQTQEAYVAALYDVVSQGATVVGRSKDNRHVIGNRTATEHK